MADAAAGPSASPPGSPTTPTAPMSPINASLPIGGGPALSSLTPRTGAVTTTTTSNNNNSNNAVGDLTAAGGTTGTVTTNANGTNVSNNGYNSMGSGYGGMSMDPYGMGYGGMGYGGMGYGGMGYGGMGMMGMGGIGMMGLTPEAQRAQMMMMMTNSIMQLWGMFSQVLQMTLGSTVQFVGEYVGINQRMGQIEEEQLNLEERYQNRKYDLRKALSDIPRDQRYVPKVPRFRKHKQPSAFRRFILRLLRHVALFFVAYFLAKRIGGWLMARSGKRLMETSASNALSTAPKLN